MRRVIDDVIERGAMFVQVTCADDPDSGWLVPISWIVEMETRQAETGLLVWQDEKGYWWYSEGEQ